jgi:hypothetical protein
MLRKDGNGSYFILKKLITSLDIAGKWAYTLQ